MSIFPSLSATCRALVAAAFLITISAGAQAAPTDVVETLAATPSLSTLSALVKQAGLTDTLKAAGPFTVFAPSNDAFKAVKASDMEVLGKDTERLKEVLSYHVIPGKVMSADVKNGKVKTVQGTEVGVSKAGEFVTLEGAMGEGALVTQADVAATNGVVHVIDTVMMPPVKK